MSANPVIHPHHVEPYVAVVCAQDTNASMDRRVLSTVPNGPMFSESDESEDAIVEPVVSSWCMSPLKRIFDLACVIPALLLLAPVMLFVAILVWLTSEGPILFRQPRVGLHRRTFTIYKFRTMYHNLACAGPCVTKTGDTRLTPVGEFLRKYKLDEFPQLYNVLSGDMSLVGPRPKLPQHEHLDMHYRPGVTGAATLAFANEETMLRDVPDEMLEEFHVNVVSPIKKQLDREYQERATFTSDFRLLVDTVLKRRTCMDIRSLVAGVHAPDHAEQLVTLWAAEQAGD